MKEQLKEIMNHYGLNATRFSDEIGVQRSSISHILSGRNQPSYEFILKIIKSFPEINVEWLITGKGNIEKYYEKNTVIQKDSFKNTEDNMNRIQKSEDNEEDIKAINIDKNDNLNKFTDVNSIERVVFFYRNGTFKDYKPG